MPPESSIQTGKQERTQRIIEEMCAGFPDACGFVFTCFNLAMTWDHIADEEEIDKEMAGAVFKAMTTEWAINQFYRDHGVVLSAVMANAISAWESSNRRESPKIKALDIFSELASTVCFLLHGMAGVDKWMPEFRKLMWEICVEDDAKDGGKL